MKPQKANFKKGKIAKFEGENGNFRLDPGQMAFLESSKGQSERK